MVTTRPPKTIVKPTALGPVANTDTKLLIYGLFQKGRVLAQDGITTLEQSKPLDKKLTAWRPGTFFVQKRSLHIPHSVDKDEYTLTMGLKDRATKAALPALSSNGRPLEGEIQLGSITIN